MTTISVKSVKWHAVLKIPVSTIGKNPLTNSFKNVCDGPLKFNTIYGCTCWKHGQPFCSDFLTQIYVYGYQ